MSERLNKLRFNINELDKSYPENPNFSDNGVQIVKYFLKQDLISRINLELNTIFVKPLINSFQGSIWSGSSYKLGHQLKTITFPSRLKSINLLELAVEISNFIPNKNEYHLTDLQIYSEKKNKKKLEMHTDKRRGMIRAQVYLKGGEDNSGAFQYFLNSHKFNHSVDHHLNNFEIDALNQQRFSCSGIPGDLIIFDTWGFHGKTKCEHERRSIFFEFQKIEIDKEINTVKSSIDINNRCLTKKVIDNIKLFLPCSNQEEFYKGHGLDKDNSELPLFFIFKNIKTVIQVYFFKLLKIIKK